MKKLLCILLAVVLVCAFFTGCKDSNASPGASSDGGAEGKKILSIFMTLTDTHWQMMDGMFKEMFEAKGYTYDSVSGESDPLKQIEQVENGVVQGYDLILIMPVTGEAVADACQAAMDAGVYVYCFINNSVNHTVYRTVDAAYSGEILVQYAVEEWALEHFDGAADGSINTVLMGYSGDSHTLARLEAAKEKIASYPQLNLIEVSETEGTASAGQSAAENILTKHPDKEINLWIVCDSSQAIGVNAAIMAENSGVDYIEDVGMASNAINAESAALMAASVTNDSVYRICAASGGRLDINLGQIVEQCDLLLKGESVDPFSPVNVDLVTPENLADFGY